MKPTPSAGCPMEKIRLTECRLKLLLQGLTQLGDLLRGNLSKLGIPGSPARIRVLFNFISVKEGALSA